MKAGKTVAVAHHVSLEPASRLAQIIAVAKLGTTALPVNSSHHQAADSPGDGLRVVAKCKEDGVVEAVEGTSADHFVLAVQWHPERGFDEDAASQALFSHFVEVARKYKPRDIS